MVEGVSEREDAPTDRTRLRIGCSTVVIFCCRFGGDHANAAPVLSRRLTRRLTERTGEVGLARKFEGQRNMDQRLVTLPEQLFGELEHGSRFSTASARSCKIAQKRTAPKADGQTRSLKQVGPDTLTAPVARPLFSRCRCRPQCDRLSSGRRPAPPAQPSPSVRRRRSRRRFVCRSRPPALAACRRR
jgi:hypothetical protein